MPTNPEMHQLLGPDGTLVGEGPEGLDEDTLTAMMRLMLLGRQIDHKAIALQRRGGPPVFADINTWFMPLGDFRMQAYVDNWLRYHTIRGTLASRWNELVGDPSREIGVASVPVYSPFLAAGQVVGEALGS